MLARTSWCDRHRAEVPPCPAVPQVAAGAKVDLDDVGRPGVRDLSPLLAHREAIAVVARCVEQRVSRR